MIAMMAAKVMTIIVTMMLAVMETGGNDVVGDGNGTQSMMAMTMAMVVTMVAMISTKRAGRASAAGIIKSQLAIVHMHVRCMLVNWLPLALALMLVLVLLCLLLLLQLLPLLLLWLLLCLC